MGFLSFSCCELHFGPCIAETQGFGAKFNILYTNNFIRLEGFYVRLSLMIEALCVGSKSPWQRALPELDPCYSLIWALITIKPLALGFT